MGTFSQIRISLLAYEEHTLLSRHAPRFGLSETVDPKPFSKSGLHIKVKSINRFKVAYFKNYNSVLKYQTKNASINHFSAQI